MADETIVLAQNYKPEKMEWPAMGSIKLDGMPVRLIRGKGSVTRQGEDYSASHMHIIEFFEEHFAAAPGVELIGELYYPGMNFKTISGQVRKAVPAPHLKLYVFDMYANYPEDAYQNAPYRHRMDIVQLYLQGIADQIGSEVGDLPIQIIPWVELADHNAAVAFEEAVLQADPSAEGIMVHAPSKKFTPGKRCWGNQRMKREPTVDVEVVGMEEAVSKKTGEGLGRVGRLHIKYYVADAQGRLTGIVGGCGPGKLSHQEAAELWQEYSKGWTPRIAEVKSMKDHSYEALRQPTFQRWRPDKRQADTVSRLDS